ncbi:alpha/beta hydrolase fold domain-containing protein [Tomitella biformata]|uniref:alpha/beta hydrolase fold domain-containing protein n=1 Tax=Tomitella biformata TaxID=630403 RepID=UPI0004B4DD30|nr:alpha/beta hydrolase fold domain-containing protein [Tomitella biformata]
MADPRRGGWPPYLPPRLVATALRPFYWAVLNPRLPWHLQRRIMDAAAVIQTVPKGVDRKQVLLGGRPAEQHTPIKGAPGAESPRAILYLHGGAFTMGSPRTHRSLAAHLALAAGAKVFTLDYRLAPEHPYPAAVDDAVAAFVELASRRGSSAAQVAVAGDSAGGGIAAATARRAIDEHGLVPGALALIAPSVDPANRDTRQAADVVVRTAWVYPAADAYRGSAAPHDPGFAPMYAPTEGLPPTFVTVGTAEVLHDQVCAYVERLRDGGVEVEFVRSDVLWHVAQLQASLVKPAAESVAAIGAFIRSHLA